MKHFITLVIAGLILFSSWQTIGLLSSYSTLKSAKEDLAEINKINYGLFDITIWKEEALKVFENRIGQFEISPKAYDQVIVELEKYLRSINKDYIESGKIFEKIFADAEKNEKINKIFLKLIKENTKPQLKLLNIPQYIPGMAIKLANELKKQEPQLRDIMREELKKILKNDENSNFSDPRLSIYQKYGAADIATTNQKLSAFITSEQMVTDRLVKVVYGCLLSAFLMAWLLSGYLGIVTSVTIMTIVSIILLVIGVNLPMIDIEAILNSFTINVLGTDIGFDRQYMYYQSKSILDVTDTLIRGKGLDLKLVGIMVLCFSVIFPFIKLILSGLYLYSSRIRENKIVQNIIFYLGKWSMADVFVVALFMAYIGFYGIISSQLDSIAHNK
ncbi:MAG: paraquat-inducible protein A, partial [Saprospiraceae bacterium]|nr:paraquat-inducible protein A [Saprospiraceae bacterium]